MKDVILRSGPTVEEAKRAARVAISNGYWVVRETVLSDGSKQSLSKEGKTLETARASTLAALPEGAALEGDAELQAPQIVAVDLECEGTPSSTEETWAKSKAPSDAKLTSTIQKSSAKAGVFGIGRRKAVYSFFFEIPAVWRIDFLRPPTVELNIGQIGDKLDLVAVLGRQLESDLARMTREDKGYSIELESRALAAGGNALTPATILYWYAAAAFADPNHPSAPSGEIDHKVAHAIKIQDWVCVCGANGFRYPLSANTPRTGPVKVVYDCSTCGESRMFFQP